MPHTVNGIGTHYYGEKNVQRRPGVCEFCRRDVVLSSYDTRLWFVIVFIPIIPLGKKHILNYCPSCTRHRATSLTEWEKIKNKNLSEAMAGMAANPQDPKAAVKAHSALIAFGQTDEAEKLMLLMQERFANDAATQAYLGSMLQYIGKYKEALPYYQRALTLNPELPEARVAVALDLINSNKLDDAHNLLRFLEAPGKAEYPGALFALASGYQRSARHAEALKLFNLLLERFPKLGHDKKFRSAFTLSQMSTGAPPNLPPRKIRWSPLVGLGSAIALILCIALASNYYISQHQTLYLVSGFKQPVSISLPHHEKTTISNHGLWTLTLPEGKYQATLSGATNQTVDFTIASSFWARWFGKPVFVFNAAGTALLIYENATYSANPATGNGSFSFYYGKPFFTLPNVDYAFTPFPDHIRLENHESSVQKTHIGVFPEDPKDGFMMLLRTKRMSEALDLAEWHLRLHPEATQTLPYYSYCADVAGQQQRAQAFFAEAVKRRPVELEWHRMYQESRITLTHDAPQVIAEYEALLQVEPTNSALLYLCGRLQMSKRKAMTFYESAITQNPGNYFAHFALGESYVDFGDLTKALVHMAEADRLDPNFPPFEEELYTIRLALKDFAGLEKNLQANLRAKPLDLQSTGWLGETFIAEGHPEQMEKLLAGCQSNIEANYPGDDGQLMLSLRAQMLYSTGKFDELEKLGSGKRSAKSKIPDKFAALVELGRLQDAAAALKARGPGNTEPFELLALSSAWKLSGDNEKAAATRAEAIKALAASRPENEIAAGWLKGSRPIPLDEALDLSMSPHSKKILLVALAQTFPQDNAPLLAAARQLNINRNFPFHLINRLTDPKLTGGTPPK